MHSRIGLISDTHGFLDPAVRELFRGVDHIIHAGDVGAPSLLLELEDIAPVSAVAGNTDEHRSLPGTVDVTLGQRVFFVVHEFNPDKISVVLQRRLIKLAPDVVVFGHTHRSSSEVRGRTLYVNPGYAGRTRLGQPRSVAVLRCDETGMNLDFLRF